MKKSCKQTSCSIFNSCSKAAAVTSPGYKKGASVDILFVYQNTSGKEFARSGIEAPFLNLLEDIGRNKKFTFAISAVYRGSKRSINDQETCFKNLLSDISRLSPKVVIPLGPSTYSSILGYLHAGDNQPDFHQARLFGTRLKFNTVSYSVLPTYSFQETTFKLSMDGVIGGFSLIGADIRKALLNPSLTPFSTEHCKITLLSKLSHVEKFVHKAISGDHTSIVCDTETKNLNRYCDNKVSMIQFSLDDREAYILPYQHPDSPFSSVEQKAIRKLIKNLFCEKGTFKSWLFANAVFDLHQLFREFKIHPFSIKATIYDVLLFAFSLNENRISAKAELLDGYFALKPLAREYLMFKGYDQNVDMLELRGKGLLHDNPLDEKLLRYAADDVFVPRALAKTLFAHAELEGYKKKMVSFHKFFMDKMIRLVTTVEHTGLPMDMRQMLKLSGHDSILLTRLREIEDNFRGNKHVQKANKKLAFISSKGMKPLFGTPYVFSPSKPDHLRVLFFDTMKLAPTVQTAKGLNSTGKFFQNDYAEKVEEVKLFKEWQSVNTLFKMFVKPLASQIKSNTLKDFADERVRPKFFISGTITGRLSAGEPNPQQFPGGEAIYAKETKSLFKARKGCVFIEGDHAAAEVRWLCNLAGDLKYAETFHKIKKVVEHYKRNPTKENERLKKTSGDPHIMTSSIMFNKEPIDVSKQERKNAKSITFGLIYGEGLPKLAESLKLTVDETKELVDKFFSLFPASKEYLFSVEKAAEKVYYIDSPIFRRRRLLGFLYKTWLENKELRSIFFKLSNRAKRLARNSPVQGISSDCTCVGAAFLAEHIHKKKLDWKIVNLVHDSVWAEVPVDQAFEYIKKTEYLMTKRVEKFLLETFGFKMVCPLAIDFKIGRRLGYAKDLDYKHVNFKKQTIDLTEYL